MSSNQILSQEFYQSEDVVTNAQFLLGKVLTTKINGVLTSGLIVETEAYRGPDDKGCHAYGGRRTERTSSMYLSGGHAYVYLCYGIHPMINVVTGPKDFAHAVLIRGIQPLYGLEIMAQRRGLKSNDKNITNGPGKLGVALGITKDLNACPFFKSDSEILIEDHNLCIDVKTIYAGPRVGMSIHVGSCAHRPWRFYIKDNPWVSKPLSVDYRGKW
ncbi:MAG: DNA-3-methyladenine glycosylase [Saprospiraceae bacterium]